MLPRTPVNRAFLPTAFALSACLIAAEPAPAIPLKPHDVVGWLGGAPTSIRASEGRMETLLTAAAPELGAKIRTLAWEGDTVFQQARPVNFPSPADELRKAGATVTVLEFGQAEALAGASAGEFGEAYGKLLDRVAAVTPRVVLILPPPFEKQAAPRPDPSAQNARLEEFTRVIREFGRRPGVAVIDLYTPMNLVEARTTDGWHSSPLGDAAAARIMAGAFGGSAIATAPALGADGGFKSPDLEALRREVAAKNALWVRYARPMNWAFLGGDRTEQPSSRDHDNPKHRWFPEEMEQYPALIADAERRAEDLARKAHETSLR
jgi:GDSL-like Lipase/Acylhydrolase family